MKKLLVLMLVFGVASMASAGLQLVADYSGEDIMVGESVAVSMQNDADIPSFGNFVWAIAVTSGEFVRTAEATIPAVDNLSATIIGDLTNETVVNPEGTVGYWGSILYTGFTGPLPAGTTIFEAFNLTFDQQGIYNVMIFDDVVEGVAFGDPAGSFDVNVIPEPMTMALLGLGGLFLRRRMA